MTNVHLLQEVGLGCDRAAVLVKGELRRVGPVDELTRLTEPDVEFTVQGSEVRVRECLQLLSQNTSSETLTSLSGERIRFVLPRPTQLDVTRCIDALRQQAVEIVSIVPKRHSLEDAFLTIVADDPTQDTTSRS